MYVMYEEGICIPLVSFNDVKEGAHCYVQSER